jgi:type VI protein secretion system component Hcp
MNNATYYLWVDGIPGSSTTSLGAGWIALKSLSLANDAAKEAWFILGMDTSAPALFSANATGKRIAKAQVVGWRDGKICYWVILQDVLVSDLKTAAPGFGETTPVLELELAYASVSTPQPDANAIPLYKRGRRVHMSHA